MIKTHQRSASYEDCLINDKPPREEADSSVEKYFCREARTLPCTCKNTPLVVPVHRAPICLAARTLSDLLGQRQFRSHAYG